jgi:hypothetical protein
LDKDILSSISNIKKRPVVADAAMDDIVKSWYKKTDEILHEIDYRIVVTHNDMNLVKSNIGSLLRGVETFGDEYAQEFYDYIIDFIDHQIENANDDLDDNLKTELYSMFKKQVENKLNDIN